MSAIGQPAKKNLVFKLLFKGEGNFKHVVQQLLTPTVMVKSYFFTPPPTGIINKSGNIDCFI